MQNLFATQSIRKYTKDDLAGGFLTNAFGEFLGRDQLNCMNETATYDFFLQTLIKNGKIHYFVTDGPEMNWPGIAKDWSKGGHMANRLKNLRTGEIFIFDSWFESGGTAAHILSLDDWKQLPITHFAPIDFVDLVDSEL